MIIIDRFEGDMAVLEMDGFISEVRRELVAENALEGDVLFEKDGVFYVDSEATDKRREVLRTRLRRLINRDHD